MAKTNGSARLLSTDELEAAKIRARRERARRSEQGETSFTVFLPTTVMEQIDALKAHNDLPNRSQVVKQLLEHLLARPDIIKDCGL